MRDMLTFLLLLLSGSMPLVAQHHAVPAPVAANLREHMMMWLSDDSHQSDALEALRIMRNHGTLVDLPQKEDIFESLLSHARQEDFLFDAVSFLSGFPGDMSLLERCRRTVSSRRPGRRMLLASLAYLHQYDYELFAAYIRKSSYPALDVVIKGRLANDKTVSQLRDQYLEATLDSLMNPRMATHGNRITSFDQPDPHYAELLKEAAEHLPSFVNRHRERYMRPTLPLVLLYLLGESASFSSFDLLLENYLSQQNIRSAITLACCTGLSQVETLFRVLHEHKLLDDFLKSILTTIPGGHWDTVRKLSFEDRLFFYKTHYEAILTNVRLRAKPILG